jgi:thiol-disulfide isomerase/thioredoxin
MKNSIIIGAALVMTSLLACSNYKQEDTASTMQQQADSNAAASPSLQPSLPTFAVESIHGNSVNLESFKGKKVFVNLWASWCPPCKREMPSIEKLYQSVDTNKVAFVMISLDDQFEKAKAYIRSAKLQLPVYYPEENLPDLFNVEGIPSTFIFNEAGQLIKRIDGGDFYDTDEYRALLK